MPRTRDYIWPPHPSDAARIPPSMLKLYDATGEYIAQRKYGGDAASICWCDGQVWVYSRHGKPFANYSPPPALAACFATLAAPGEWWFHGELMHSRSKSPITGQQRLRDTVVLYDVMMANGRYLLQPTQEERLGILADACGRPQAKEEGLRALVVAEQKGGSLWLAESFGDDFEYRFDEFFVFRDGLDVYPEVEGLVLRQKASRLTSLGNKEYDVPWIVRCRKPKPGKYDF